MPSMSQGLSASSSASSYVAYGLRVRSEIALPFLAGPAEAEPDLTIRFGAVPRSLTGRADPRVWESTPDGFLLNVEGVARYLVREAREIVVQPAGGDQAAVTAFLLSSVMAACLQQRGIIALHASAIATGAGAVLFMGVSGIGKSALVAALVERGYQLLADNLTGVDPSAGDRPMALPASPCVRLWADTVDKLAWWPRTQGRVREELEKYMAPVTRFRAAPLGVRAVIQLTAHNREKFEITPISPAQALASLLRFTYRSRCVRELGVHVEHFGAVAGLARRVRFGRVTRPTHPFLLDELADEVGRYLRADVAAAADGVRSPVRRDFIEAADPQ